MRIRGSGSDFFGFGDGGSRSDSFKRGRRLGQKVRGTLLKWVSTDMAWVNIEGHKLIAQLQSKPRVGASLTFLIKQLYPEIILKEIFEGTSGGISALSLASDVETARSLFETHFRQHTAELSKAPYASRRATYLALLRNDKKMLGAHLDVVNCIQAINRHIDTNRLGILSYAPWLIPSARRYLGLTRRPVGTTSQNLTESVIEFEIGEFGLIRTEFLSKGNDIGYRLKLQHLRKADSLKKYLKSRDRSGLTGSIDCLGISQLSQSEHGGLLAELVFKQNQ